MNLKRCFVVILFSAFSSVSQASRVDPCLVAADPVVRLVSFFTELIEDGALGIEVLRPFVELDQGSERGLILLENALAENPIYLEHFKSEFQKLFEAQRMSFRSLIGKYFLATRSRTLELSRVELDTVEFIEFARIGKGTTTVRDAYDSGKVFDLEVSISVDLEVMTTHVTMGMFEELVGFNPMKGRDQPDFPMHRSSSWMAMLFANALSEREGLEPVYDIPEFAWDDLKKDLVIDSPVSFENVIRVQNEGGQRPNGYRLPTNNEWKFILGSIEQDLILQEGFNDLTLKNIPENQRYFWSGSNSKGLVQPVASKDPFTVQGQALYDLYGLAKHWMHPSLGASSPYIDTGTVFRDVSPFVTSGGGFFHDSRAPVGHGFRLVREVSP